MYRRILFFTVGKMRKKKIKKGILLCVAAMLVLCVGMCLKHYKYIVRIKNDYQNRLTDYQVRYLDLGFDDFRESDFSAYSERNGEYVAKVLKIC